MEQIPTLTNLIDEELDRQYNSTAGRMLAQIQIMSTSQTSRIQTALRNLDEEMIRADEEDRMVDMNHPAVEQTLDAYEQLMIATGVLIVANALSIENSGRVVAPAAVTSRVFLSATGRIMEIGRDPLRSLGTYTTTLERAGITWNVLSLTGNSVRRFVDSNEWINRMERWGEGYADLTRRTLLDGIQNGWGPLRIAEMLRQHAQNIPRSSAENLTRTLQITAYREASLDMERINGKFILKKIRIASLDQRTCLACIALHGTELAPGQRVDDHYRGRCSEYYVVPGGAPHPEFMQVDSPAGGRRLVPWQSGEEWFASLPTERQLAQASFAASPGKWNVYQAGNPLSSFVTTHVDNVFGNQILENSIVGMFGDAARQYYVR